MRRKQEEETMAFCKVSFDLFCDKGNEPRYRLYVNNELFTERTYVWARKKSKKHPLLCINCQKNLSKKYCICKTNVESATPMYLRENLQIDAPPGEYAIRLEKVDPGKYRIRNTTVDLGPAEIIDSTTFRIIE